MPIPLVDLRAAFLPIRDEVMRGFETALDEMQLFLGPNVRAFEEEFATYCESPHGVGLSSGTDALICALSACGVGRGDEVIVPSHTFFASVEAVVHVGATPVLVDVEDDNLTLDVEAVRSAVTPATAAIVPVHLYGHPADMDPILDVASEHGLRVIEDAAQAHGARYKGRRCGSMGDAACFSFYFTKNLGAVGEAGFATSRDPEIADRMRLLRDHGHITKYEHAVIGHNFRLDELQAVVLRAKLPRLDAGNTRRGEIAARYRQSLPDSVRHLEPRDDCEPVHHLFPIRVPQRDALREHLSAQGIGTGVHYPLPAHRQAALRDHPHRIVGAMSVTQKACAELLSLPMYPELTDAQVEQVARAVAELLSHQ